MRNRRRHMAAPRLTATIVMVLGLLVVLDTGVAQAGTCEDNDAAYIATLEKAADRAEHDPARELNVGYNGRYCRDFAFVASMNKRIHIGPRNAETFAERRRWPLRSRLVAACRRILEHSRDRKSHAGCVALLASSGVRRVGRFDVLELHEEFFPMGLNLKELVMLGDRDVTPILVERFAMERVCTHFDGAGEPAGCVDFSKHERNRWVRKAYVEHKLAVLSVMWHIADPASRSFLSEVVRTDKSALVRQRARKVLDHLDVVEAKE